MKSLNRRSALILICLIYLCTILFNRRWANGLNPIFSDVSGYYAYLPAIIIYHDATFSFLSNDKFVKQYLKSNKYPPENWFLNQAKNGNRVPKYSIGVAVLTAPFFLIAHYLSLITGFDDNGYSMLFKIMFIVCNIFYTFLGLFVLSKILSKYFSELVGFISLISIALCTNMFFYSTTVLGMSHLYSFCLFAILFYYAIKWHQTPKYSYAIYIGLLIGVITMVRATNIIIALLPALYGVTSWTDFKAKLTLIQQHYLQWLLAGVFFVLGIVPQILFWKLTTDSWFFYSYNAERFYFNDPRILSGMFSFRSGWLIYTPIMAFSLIGFYNLRKNIPNLFLPILLFFLLNVYIIFSWWSWWYGLSFSIRPLIESYVLLIFPFAAFVTDFIKRGRKATIAAFCVIFLFFTLNIFQSIQHQRAVIIDDRTNFRSYLYSFGKLRYTEAEKLEYQKLLDHEHHAADR